MVSIIPNASSMPILNGMHIIRKNKPLRSSCQLELGFFFFEDYSYPKIYLFIYLASLSLSCGTWDLRCGRWTPEHAGLLSICGAWA